MAEDDTPLTPTSSVLHRAVYGGCLAVAGLLLVGSVLAFVAYAVAVTYFVSDFGD